MLAVVHRLPRAGKKIQSLAKVMSEMKTLEDGLGGRRAVTSLLGVGSVTARRLASRFAVHTVHELASVGTLEEAAAAPGSHAALRKLRLLALEYAMHNVTNATDKTVRKQPTMNTVVKEKTPTMVSRWHPVKVGIVSQAMCVCVCRTAHHPHHHHHDCR